jgi:hypothetical protein
MSSYNNYLRTKNGNLCCCPGAQGPKGSQGVRGPQGIQGIDGALKITRGSDVRNSQPEFILYDTSMIQLTPPSERNDSLGAYAIIGYLLEVMLVIIGHWILISATDLIDQHGLSLNLIGKKFILITTVAL